MDIIDSWIKSNNRGIRRRGNVRNGNGRYRGRSNCYDRIYHKTNPVVSEGDVSECLVCGLVFDWAEDCPVGYEVRLKEGAFHNF